MVFYTRREKHKNHTSFNPRYIYHRYAFLRLQTVNRMAVIYLNFAVNDADSSVSHINDVGKADGHSRRKLFISGKWIISVATKSKMAVIVNAETRTVHGKIRDIDHGDVIVSGAGSRDPESFLVMIWLSFS